MTIQEHWERYRSERQKGYDPWLRWNPIPYGLLNRMEEVGDAGLMGDYALLWTLVFPPLFMMVGCPLLILSPLYTWYTNRWRQKHEWPRYAPWGGIGVTNPPPEPPFL